MSWECNCYKARERGREHQPGSHIVCPFCGRTREQVRLLEGVDALLRWLDSGGPLESEDRILHPLRDAVLGYRGGPRDSDEKPEWRATSVLKEPTKESQLVFRSIPTIAAYQIATDRSPQEALDTGYRLWEHSLTGIAYYIITEDETRVVLRRLGGLELDNTYVRRDELVRDYVPCDESSED
jgi:hypothetical protein